jgi:uncharacterized protein YfaS (alpha-2-macroglobulin family)
MKTNSAPAAARAALLAILIAALAPALSRAVDLRLAGRVVDAETQASIAGAIVELANAGGGQGYFRARTDGHGGFALERIPAERWYALTVSAEGYADYVLGSWQFPSAQKAAEVVIPLDRAGSIALRLTGSDGRTPIAGAKVQVRPEQAAEWWRGYRPPPAPLFTDAQGTVRFDGLARGYYTVTAEASDRMPFEGRRVAVRRGETTPLSASLARPAFVSGFVRLADGTGVAGLTVTARGTAEAVGTTLGDGSFTVGGLPPGRYRIEVTHEGFEPVALKELVALSEGESRGGFAITVTPRPADLAFVLEREAFGLDEPVKVGLRSYRMGYVDYVLFEIPPDRLLRSGARSGSLPAPEDTAGLTVIQRWQKATAEGPPWTWREQELTLPGTMLPGAYLLVGRAGELERRAVLFVTDLSLIVKRSKTQLVVSAASLKTGRPVPGARITISRVGAAASAEPGKWREALARATPAPAGTIVTDERGIARVHLAGDPVEVRVYEWRESGITVGSLSKVEPPLAAVPVRVLASSESNGLSIVDAPVAPAAQQGGDQLYLYTDRPIYRPGHAVFWKAFVRRATDRGYAPPEATHVALSLSGPGGATLQTPAPAHAGAGSADGAIALPPDAALGDWTLAAVDGRARGTASFAVEEYRKPEFRVDVTPDREIVVNGDEVRFRVAASYFFGAPVFGALVRYNLFESRLPGEEAWWNEEEEGGPASGYGRVLKSGETRTDLDGRVALSFVPARATYDRRLTLEVEVVDPTERRVSGRGSAVVGRGLFALSVKPLARVVGSGEPVGIEVTTRDHAGKPVRALVRVTLDQDAWNPLERRYTRAARPLAEAQVTTDSTGRGFVPLRAGRSGDLEIRARSEDARGNLVTAETSVWVWDARIEEYAYRYPTLEVLADRERYAPGDTATIVINTDVRDATVLAALEGREVEDLRVLTIRGNTGIVRFPIRPEYAPNAFVTVHLRKAKEVRARTLELPVAAARHDLAITLNPDKSEYRPGETANVAVRTADASGAPVVAELSLGVVDEAIYSLRADATPDPHDVFYGRRADWVTTVVSFPTLYYGGADKGGREEVRKDFRDVAYWEPSVRTDEAGRASVSFRWPDNLTTWRLTSRGATATTLVGKAVEKTLVSKPLVARLSGPRAFVVGDRAALISGVTNRSRAPLTGIEERLEAAGPVTIEGKTSRRSDLPAGGESRGEWPVAVREIPARADTVPQAAFTFRARAKTDADALEIGIPVLPRAVPLRPHGAGVLTGSDATIAVALPGDLVRPGSSVALELSPSIAAMALGARDYLAEYPWGCTEQTANALRATLDLGMVEKRLGVSFPGPRDSSAAVKRGVERLLALQHADGGWGWWSEGETDPYLTALALDALGRAAFAGRAGPEVDGALQRGAMAMAPLLDQVRTEDGEAYVLMHLGGLLSLPNAKERFADLGGRLEGLALATFSARDKLSDAGLALCALGHLNLGRMTEARALVQSLAARAIEDGAGVHWRASADAWFDEDVEATAYAFSALLAVSPSDPRALGALRWLATQRRADHWRSTRVTAPVAIALGDWLVAHAEEAKPAYRLAVRWNGAPLLERAVGAADMFARGARVVIPGSRLVPGENRLALAKSGAGSVFWSWEARALVPSPGPTTTAEKRLSLTREYLHAERTADLRGRPRWLTTPLAPGEGFKTGEAVLVRLTIHAAGALDHLILEDPRPAGFEVDDLVPEGTEHPWDLHAEARDTRSVFFLSWLGEGDTVLEYLVRPETAGALVALPASLSAMYDPDLVARSGEGAVAVSGGPSR